MLARLNGRLYHWSQRLDKTTDRNYVSNEQSKAIALFRSEVTYRLLYLLHGFYSKIFTGMYRMPSRNSTCRTRQRDTYWAI